MGKLKEIWNGEHRSFVRYASVITVFFIIYTGFLGKDSILRWVRASFELRSQRRQIERYQKEIDAMDAQIRMLSNDRDSLEEFARENFSFAAPGDDVYIDE